MTPQQHATIESMQALPAGATARRLVHFSLVAAAACSGCGWANSFVAPRPLPPSFSQPPVEPPTASDTTPPAPATVLIDAPPVEPPPAPATAVAPDHAGLRSELDLLKAELADLRSRQEQSQSALESLTASSLATASRSAAIEAHLALQSSLIDDLRTATQQQQREQWKALDAVSEGIDRMLKRNQEQLPAQPAPATPADREKPYISPGGMPLQEILSQHPDAQSGRGVR